MIVIPDLRRPVFRVLDLAPTLGVVALFAGALLLVTAVTTLAVLFAHQYVGLASAAL